MKYDKMLNNSAVNQIEQISINIYKITYIDQIGRKYVVKIQKNPFAELEELFLIKESVTEKTVINFVYSQYPLLQF